MIHKISSAVSEWLEKEGSISIQERKIYSYAVYSIVFGMIPFFLSILLGCLLGMVFEGIMLIIPFMLIRKFSGGFHLDSTRKCIAFSGIILTLSFCITKYISFTNQTLLLKPFVWASTCCLFVCSPIDSDARKLKPVEIRLFGRIARIISASMLAIYLVFDYLEVNKISVPIGIGMILASLLQLPCIINRVLHSLF